MVREHGSPFLFGHRNDPDLLKIYDATNAETRLAYSFYNQGPDPTQLPYRSERRIPNQFHQACGGAGGANKHHTVSNRGNDNKLFRIKALEELQAMVAVRMLRCSRIQQITDIQKTD